MTSKIEGIKESAYLRMLRFRSVLVDTDPDVSGEGNAGDKVSDEDIFLVDEVHVEEVGEGLAIEEGDDVGVHVEEEGERGRNISAEHAALVLVHSRPEEALWLLEPEIVQPVRHGPQQRPPVTSRDLPDRELRRRRCQRQRWRHRWQ